MALRLRNLILAVAEDADGVGPLEETLKWNQPAYLPSRTRSGTTLRIDAHARGIALYFHCQTDLAERYRQLYDEVLAIEGNRAIVLPGTGKWPETALRHCIAMALTYHSSRKQSHKERNHTS